MSPDDKFICHRVWQISSNGSVLITKGDNNMLPDSELIYPSMYLGVVIAMIKKKEIDQ